MVLVSGHGVHDSDPDETYYFLPHEADVEHLSIAPCPSSSWKRWCRRPRLGASCVLLDTCESGACFR